MIGLGRPGVSVRKAFLGALPFKDFEDSNFP